MDVWQHSTLGNGDRAHELVEFLVVAHGKLKVAWRDASLLVVAGCVAGKLKNLSSQVLKYSGEIHWGTSSDAVTVAAALEVAVHTANWELKSSPR